ICILGIESSCDETSAAVWQGGKILSHVIASQQVHELYGGVVPELASRAHEQHIIPVVDAALRQAVTRLKELYAIGFTQSPGLIGSLLVGSCFAKALSLSLDIPLISVNHLQAHVLANFIEPPFPEFPFLCLTVSGGHTQIVLCRDYLDQEVIGQTRDDAAGEAFDKAAKMLGLPYPGGPQLDRLAKNGDPHRFPFPEPRMPGLDFSFSGLKTSILYFIRENQRKDPDFIHKNLEDLCASVQDRICSILIHKLRDAALQYGISRVSISGGVSANSALRKTLNEYGARFGWEIFVPRLEYCTDNAAMIAITAYYKYLSGRFIGLDAPVSARGILS
ncbi:MAG TPA: tRNA (adenosine(37)-N6)-threonylcarbamoyltransferase complex transferase subunit TsaD, partial [Chitinophagaceae bacterium]|nr:tRNA (adenosine(37)-N6)-threonylcarbamoyltransferase complex transferase subunit TsaD [Chitinophagaceae bacterium]